MEPPTPVTEPRRVVVDQEEFWLPWLRAIMVINLAMAIVEVISGAVSSVMSGWMLAALGGSASVMTPSFLLGILMVAIMPLLHLCCSITCLRRWNAARSWMLAYCCAAIALVPIGLAYGIYVREFYVDLGFFLMQLDSSLAKAVLPLVTLLFLSRPQIRALFAQNLGGFSVIQ